VSDRWVVLRVDEAAHSLRPVGTSDARERDRAIRDTVIAAGEYVAVPTRYLSVAIVHDERLYSVTAHSSKGWLT
jgi:hypothetical protein